MILRSFALPSRDAQQILRFRTAMFAEVDREIFLAFTVSAGTKYCDRLEEVVSGEVYFPMPIDSLFRMSQVVIKLSVLQEFERTISAWLELPTMEFSFQFGGSSKCHRLGFCLRDLRGARVLPDYQLELTYSGSNSSASIRIGVDVTCISMFRESLADFIEAFLASHYEMGIE